MLGCSINLRVEYLRVEYSPENKWFQSVAVLARLVLNLVFQQAKYKISDVVKYNVFSIGVWIGVDCAVYLA